MRTLTRRVLEQVGFRVIEATDGRQGVQTFDAHRDDLAGVVLDVTMPVMNGREVLDHILAVRPEMPVVISSGYDSDELMTSVRGRGRVVFLPKPFRVQDMRRALAQLMPEN